MVLNSIILTTKKQVAVSKTSKSADKLPYSKTRTKS